MAHTLLVRNESKQEKCMLFCVVKRDSVARERQGSLLVLQYARTCLVHA